MKEATGEVSMTVIVIVAVAVIGAILAAMWPKLKGTIENRHTENEVVHHEINFYNTGFREYYDSFHVPEYVPEEASEFYQYDIGIRDSLSDGTMYIKTVKEENLVKGY